MSSKKSHFAFLLAAAAFAAAPAMAQVPSERGFFGAIDGRWMWLGGDRVEYGLGSAVNATNGPGGQVLIGYRFDSQWDIALAGAVQQLLSDLTKFRNGTLSVDTTFQNFDLEVGYSVGNWRYAAGLRGFHYLQGVSYNAPPMVGYDQREIYGLGIKAGVGTRQPLDEKFAIVGGLDGALVMGSFVDSGTGAIMPSGNYWQLMPQLGAEVGVNWRADDSFSITVGGRVAASFNTAITTTGPRGTRLDYGPFVRVAYNFSGPAYRTPLMPQATQVTNPKAPNYIVFFDFDRADLTAVAHNTVRQAASDAKARRTTHLQVAGHADRAGTDEYNMALSLRRANAVKAELVRNGLPAEQIAVLGRGESEPLVPTADGVREPQNRRVVISF
ncbi:MAG TPA: Lpg1974 family pore-forming outer membrane protein [Reyranellaceae bacterium]|nr:Lpg1974 family pore-forming outer membrane protein [Reyranellaceae bacterium]